MEEAERRLLAKTRNDLGRVIPACKAEIFDLKDRQERFFNELVVHGGIKYARQLAQVPEDLFLEWLEDEKFRFRLAENIVGILERYKDEVEKTGQHKPEDIIKRKNRGMVGALQNNREAFKTAFYMMTTIMSTMYPGVLVQKKEDEKDGKGGNTYNMTIIVGSDKVREMVENAGERTRRLIEG